MTAQILPDKFLTRQAFRQQLPIALLYGVVALALLSPMSSASVLPDIADAIGNVAATVQARMALEEGQFPPRVAPWQHDGWRYPIFQFYGQFLYTFTGLVYKYLTPSNPYLACLILLWLALTVSAFFIYRTSFLLTRSQPAAILAGVSYMAAPYFLVNIHARGAFAEAVAQGVVPVVLYCVIGCYVRLGLPYVLIGAVAWFVLAATHLITFIYSSLFIGLLVLLLGITKRQVWKPIAGIGISYCLGLLLAAYLLAPAALSTNLAIRDLVWNPHAFNVLTLLPALLQPVSLPSEPQPALLSTPNLHVAVGWVMLIAWATVAYYSLSRKTWSTQLQKTRYFVAPLLIVFGLAFFLTWSPFDFWQFLPRTLWVTQFTYRLVSHSMWTGALLCAYALVLLFRARLDGRHLVVGLLLIVIASSSYLPQLRSALVTLQDVIKQPDVGYGSHAYLYKITQPQPLYGVSSLVYGDGWLMLDTEQEFSPIPGYLPVLHLEGEVPSGWFNRSITLSIIVDGKAIARTNLGIGKFTWDTPLEIPSDRQSFRMKFTTDAIIIPNQLDSKSQDYINLKSPNYSHLALSKYYVGDRHLAIWGSRLSVKGLPAESSIVPVSLTRQSFRQEGTKTTGNLVVSDQAQIVQLPVLFYPDLLDVQVDGRKASYFAVPGFAQLPNGTAPQASVSLPGLLLQSATSASSYALASLRLTPGSHKISVLFTGLRWANWISAIAWLVVTALAGYLLVKAIYLQLLLRKQ